MQISLEISEISGQHGKSQLFIHNRSEKRLFASRFYTHSGLILLIELYSVSAAHLSNLFIVASSVL